MPPPERSGRAPLRPPRARSEERFLALCSRCGACIQACPYGALLPAPPDDPAGQDTPLIDPLERGCEVCANTPCVAACPTGALHPDLPLRMGTARITGHCLNLHDRPCRECYQQCPVPGAIELIDGTARVVPTTCVGCGICSQVCPAPINAVIIMPAADRPNPDPS